MTARESSGLTTYRSYFTLIEIMVVLALVALGLGWIGIKSHRALAEARLDSGVRQVASHLELAQLLMLGHGEDLTLKLACEKGMLRVEIEGELSPNFRHFIDRWRPIRGVHAISWNGQRFPRIAIPMNVGRSDQLVAGLLGLHTRDGEERFLTLPGYPAPPKVTRRPEPLVLLDHPPYPREFSIGAS